MLFKLHYYLVEDNGDNKTLLHFIRLACDADSRFQSQIFVLSLNLILKTVIFEI